MDKIYCKKNYSVSRDRKNNIFAKFANYLSTWMDDRMCDFDAPRLVFLLIFGIPFLLILSYYLLFHFVITKRVVLVNKGEWYDYEELKKKFYNKNKGWCEAPLFEIYLNNRTNSVSFSKHNFDKYFVGGKELRKLKLDKLGKNGYSK